jgi:hypothetical protein
MQPRRALQVVLIFALSVFVALFLILLLLRSETVQNLPLPAIFSGYTGSISRLHVLIVATSANLDLCRLLLSLSILSYPQPVLIDWEGEGEYNASDSHLAKITGTLRYLEALPPYKDNDMVLMLDGFDIFMQLGPDVLLKRYYATKAAAHSRVKTQFGAEYVKENGVYDNILFGPDKTCWPADPRRPACWAIPDSPLDPKTFGPDTDQFADPQLARPKWLNSGTVMGPASDVRKLFQATMEKINKTFDEENPLKTSDQLYFSDVWADQEYIRQVSRYGSAKVSTPVAVPTTMPGIAVPSFLPCLDQEKVFVPEMKNISHEDFHVGLDYESRMFQTMAFYENYLVWKTFNEKETWFESDKVSRRKLRMTRDIEKSKKPFSAVKGDKKLSRTSWKDTSLGVNVVTGHIFPVLHFTGEKSFRDTWWTRMWYFPHAKRLLEAAGEEKEYKIGANKIENIRWEKDIPYENFAVDEDVGTGAWIDKGEHMSWTELCGTHEPVLFSREIPTRPPPEPEEPDPELICVNGTQVVTVTSSAQSTVAATRSVLTAPATTSIP